MRKSGKKGHCISELETRIQELQSDGQYVDVGVVTDFKKTPVKKKREEVRDGVVGADDIKF